MPFNAYHAATFYTQALAQRRCEDPAGRASWQSHMCKEGLHSSWLRAILGEHGHTSLRKGDHQSERQRATISKAPRQAQVLLEDVWHIPGTFQKALGDQPGCQKWGVQKHSCHCRQKTSAAFRWSWAALKSEGTWVTWAWVQMCDSNPRVGSELWQ